MKKQTQGLLLSTLTLLLSACSGSGGGNDGNESEIISEEPSTIAPPSVTPITTTPTTSTSGTVTSTSVASRTENRIMVKPVVAEYKAEVEKALQFTNQLRAEKGLPPLKYNPALAAYAQRRAEEVAGRFSHTRPDGSISFSTDIHGGGGENIAGGKNTAQETVLEQWKNSDGHYRNLMDPDYKSIGIGMVYWPGSEYGYYWVQIFGFEENTGTQYAFESGSSGKSLNTVAAKRQSVEPALKWLKLGNADIELHDVENNGSWYDIRQQSYNGVVNGYNETRFGAVRNGTQAYQVFYHGNNTDYNEMPQTGSASYLGKALISDGNTLNTNAEARIQANFSNKTLSGTLSDKANSISIQANIRGTTFYSSPNAAVETKGSFFGKNAREVGGIFYENATGKFGAFGAKQ